MELLTLAMELGAERQVELLALRFQLTCCELRLGEAHEHLRSLQRLCVNTEHESLYLALCGQLSAIELSPEQTMMYYERAWIKSRSATGPCPASMVHAIALSATLLGNTDKALGWVRLGGEDVFTQRCCDIRMTLLKTRLHIFAAEEPISKSQFVEIEDAFFRIQAPELQIEMMELLALARVHGLYSSTRLSTWGGYFRSAWSAALYPRVRRDLWLGVSRVKSEAARRTPNSETKARLLHGAAWAKNRAERTVAQL